MPVARPKISLFTVALCLSLIAHAFVLGAMVKVYARSLERIFFPGFARVIERDDAIVMDRLGKQNAVGDAIDSSPGDEPMQARGADQNQAFLTRDPPGLPNSVPMQVTAPAPRNEELEESREVRAAPFGVSGIAEQKESPRAPTSPAAPASSLSTPVSNSQAVAPPGIPAAHADTESDPVATNGMASYRAGKLSVQLGRDHRITTPRVGLSAYSEAALTLGGVELVLDLTIDRSGNVRAVGIDKSSGSSNFDQVWRVAAYQWWFEPRRDVNGKPQPESLKFTIKFL